jgi:hypothetical protein
MATIRFMGFEVFVETVGKDEAFTIWERIVRSPNDSEVWVGKLHFVISYIGKPKHQRRDKHEWGFGREDFSPSCFTGS